MLAGMGWRPGQPGAAALVLPALKWDRAGLGSNPHVKRLGAPATKFRRAAAATSPTSAAPAAAAAAAEP